MYQIISKTGKVYYSSPDIELITNKFYSIKNKSKGLKLVLVLAEVFDPDNKGTLLLK